MCGLIAFVAQWIEQTPSMGKVRGSSPLGGTKRTPASTEQAARADASVPMRGAGGCVSVG